MDVGQIKTRQAENVFIMVRLNDFIQQFVNECLLPVCILGGRHNIR